MLTDDSARPVRSLHVRVRVFGDVVLLGSASQQSFELSEPAALLWRMLDGRHSVHALCRDFGAEYGLTAQEVREDVLEVLTSFVEAGLVDDAGPGTVVRGHRTADTEQT